VFGACNLSKRREEFLQHNHATAMPFFRGSELQL
jgi:hypothetical protein